MEIRYPEIEVQLTGKSDNAFAILGAVTQALRDNGVSNDEVSKYRAESTSGNYDNLIQTSMQWVSVS